MMNGVHGDRRCRGTSLGCSPDGRVRFHHTSRRRCTRSVSTNCHPLFVMQAALFIEVQIIPRECKNTRCVAFQSSPRAQRAHRGDRQLSARRSLPCLLDRKQVDSPAVLSGKVDRISRVREHEVSYRRFEHGSQRRGSLSIVVRGFDSVVPGRASGCRKPKQSRALFRQDVAARTCAGSLSNPKSSWHADAVWRKLQVSGPDTSSAFA